MISKSRLASTPRHNVDACYESRLHTAGSFCYEEDGRDPALSHHKSPAHSRAEPGGGGGGGVGARDPPEVDCYHGICRSADYHRNSCPWPSLAPAWGRHAICPPDYRSHSLSR